MRFISLRLSLRILGLALLWHGTVASGGSGGCTGGAGGVGGPGPEQVLGGDCSALGCAAGLYCAPEKVCRARLGPGQSCIADACNTYGRCDLGAETPVCVPRGQVGIGGECVISEDCSPGGMCDSSRRCRLPADEGEACEPDWSICNSRLRCVVPAEGGEPMCLPPLPEGANCRAGSWPPDCADGLFCLQAVEGDSSICFRRLEQGYSCDQDGECADGLYCVATRPLESAEDKACWPQLLFGDVCDRALPVSCVGAMTCRPDGRCGFSGEGEECTSGGCDTDLACLMESPLAGRCGPARQEGEPCRDWPECAPGLRCTYDPEDPERAPGTCVHA